jgi:hypothetical protein
MSGKNTHTLRSESSAVSLNRELSNLEHAQAQVPTLR